MTHRSTAPFRGTRFRAVVLSGLVLALMACDEQEVLAPETALPLDEAAVPIDAPELAVQQAGGIAIGMAAQPTTQINDIYSGGKITVSPNDVLSRLSAIRNRGGRVVLMLAGNERYYKDAAGRFSLTRWKARVDRFRNINLDSYIRDGTIIGHFMLDEPNDPANWNGSTVPQSVLEEMGKHSKSRWPGMKTIVRTHPNWFKSSPRYVDAAWAQYLYRRGPARDYIRKQVADAQQRGLALVVGLNVLRGGKPNGSKMTASEVKAWGSELLNSSYPCAFMSWEYNSTYLNTTAMKSAMKELRRKAENRSKKTCG